MNMRSCKKCNTELLDSRYYPRSYCNICIDTLTDPIYDEDEDEDEYYEVNDENKRSEKKQY